MNGLEMIEHIFPSEQKGEQLNILNSKLSSNFSTNSVIFTWLIWCHQVQLIENNTVSTWCNCYINRTCFETKGYDVKANVNWPVCLRHWLAAAASRLPVPAWCICVSSDHYHKSAAGRCLSEPATTAWTTGDVNRLPPLLIILHFITISL